MVADSATAPWTLFCPICGFEKKETHTPPDKYRRVCGKRVPNSGPGTEFMKLTKELGLEQPEGCSCASLRLKMNAIGVEGCREKFTELRSEIIANLEKWNWLSLVSDCASAIWSSFVSGLVWRLDPLDPIGSLLKEAITRAENAEV